MLNPNFRSEVLDGLTTSDLSEIAGTTHAVANCMEFDKVIITGRSGPVSRSLLLAAGVPRSKFIYLDSETNYAVYRHNETPSSLKFNDRLTLVKQHLVRSGIHPDDDPSFLIVDDHIRTALKAMNYIDVFSSLGLTKFRFASFGPSISRSNLKRLMKELSLDPDKLYVPPFHNFQAGKRVSEVMEETARIYKSTRNEEGKRNRWVNEDDDESELHTQLGRTLRSMYLAVKKYPANNKSPILP